MAGDGGGQREISPRDLEGAGADVDDGDLSASAREHGGERAAAAADHQHAPRLGLAEEEVHGVDIIGEADPGRVRDALVLAGLPIGDRAGGVVLFDDEVRARHGSLITSPSVGRSKNRGTRFFG